MSAWKPGDDTPPAPVDDEAALDAARDAQETGA